MNKSRAHISAKSCGGFTLVELMVTLVVAAILVSLATPSFQNMIRTNTLASNLAYFTTAVNLARSEAVTRNKRVVICKRLGTNCNNVGNWRDGWIVFADDDGDGNLDAGEEIRYFDALKGSHTLSTANWLNWIAFNSNGRADAGSGGYPAGGLVMRLCAPDADALNDTSRSRTLSFNSAGRVSASIGTTECP